VAVRSPISVRDLMEFNPTPHAHRVAVRAGVSVAVPLLVLFAIGRLDWSMYAAFGAFTSLYGRNHVHVPRAQMQSWVGLVLVGCVVAGTATGISANRAWLAVPIAAALAGGCTYLSELQDWHPPGALFAIFAYAGCASLPRTVDDLLPAIVVSGLSATFAVVVGNIGAFWRVHRGSEEPPVDARRSLEPDGLTRHLLRAVLAVGISGAIATGVGIGHPYWAMVSAVVPLVAKDVSRQLIRGVHRIVGTALGLGVSAVLLALDLTGPGLIAAIVALQVGAELLVGRNYAVALTCITPLALLMGQLVVPQPIGVLLADRGIETVIGVVIGVLVGGFTRRSGPLDRSRRTGTADEDYSAST
jgi:hypothetical protein